VDLGRGAWAVAAVLVACRASRARPVAPSPAASDATLPSSSQTAGATPPLDTPGAHHGGHESIASLCDRDPRAGVQFCQEFAPRDPSACAESCLDIYREAQALAQEASKAKPVRTSSSVSPAALLPPAPPAARAAPAPPAPPDPYALALGDCVRGVREDGSEPTCRFFRPLDEMDFGQRHCDAKCAQLTEGFRAAHAAGASP
jgi:hypothetical protein